MLNPFFTQGTRSEQNLVQDLINEQLRMYGVDIYYIPRKYVKEKTVIKEVVQSKFDNALPIEAYVDNYDAYSGAGDVLSKFGIESKDEVRLIISRERYENYITPLIQGQSNIKLSTRPKGGDLIWFPLDDRLYEIKDIEYAKPYYQLQNLYVYELYCELFRYQDEVIDTGIAEIDDELVGDNASGYDDNEIWTGQGTTQSLLMVGTAVSATAFSGIVDGGVRRFTISNRGGGYAVVPNVEISAAPSGGMTAAGIATMIGGINVCNLNANPRLQSVQSVNVTNAGFGYTVAPLVNFRTTDGSGSGAAATTLLGDGVVGIVTLTNAGGGFVSAPTVTFSEPKHVGAAATATLESPMVGAGVSVISATISVGSSEYLFPGGTTGGVFYEKAPAITFSLPSGNGNSAEATATLDDINLTGGTIATLGLTTGGKFYTSVPTVSISAPPVSIAAASIGIAGTSLDPSTIAFSTTGRAYTSAPTVLVSTGVGTHVPQQTAVGIATIHPITGIVTAVSFDVSDPWAVGSGATIGIGYTVAPNLSFSSPSPVTATATVTLDIDGSVDTISIGNSGFGYISAPTVTIAAPDGANEAFRATGITTIRFNSVKTEGTLGISSTIITGITTTNILVGDRVRLGVGYSDLYNFIPTDTFVTSIGSGTISINQSSTNVGIATSVFEFGIDQCGIVTGIIITYGGGGYITPPVVSISNTVGDKNYIDQVVGVATATGVSVISTAGTVTSINVTDGGNLYIIPPDVTIEEPVSTSTGEFIFNEVVTGSTSGVTARVRVWNSEGNLLEIASVSGTFVRGETIVGQDSGATRTLISVTKEPQNDGFADNQNIELEADAILDFSEQNPFGMP